jgi:Dolichyl-phosphate-mannose-protein mannosyltransferase
MIEEQESEVALGGIVAPKPLPRPSLSERLEAAPNQYLLLFTVIYLFAEYCRHRHVPFWSDELFTSALADLPSIRSIWPLIKQGIELNPPLPFWITWVVHHTLGRGEFVTRLPSILGFWGMCVCLFYFVRRRSDTTHGFIALLLPLLTYTAIDGTWARGYGLMLGFSAAAMLLWQLATEGIRRSLAVPALALSLAGAVSCHYYAVYCVGAIAFGELVRIWIRKRIDPAVLAAIVVGISPLAAYVPLLAAVKEGSKAFWVQPSVQFLFQSYADLFGPAAMVLLLFLIWALRSPKDEDDWRPVTLPIYENAACLFFAAMPFVIFVAAQFSRIAFYTRYVLPVVIGFSIAVSIFAYRVGGGNRSFRNLSISIVIWFCFVPWALTSLVYLFMPTPWSALQAQYHFPQKNLSLPIVVDSEDIFMEANHYAPPNLRDHLFFLSDRDSSIKYFGSDTGDRSLVLGQTFHDFHVVRFDDFIRKNPEFLVARPRPDGWVLQKLLDDGADVQLVQLNKDPGVFVPDRLLFDVKIRPANSPAGKPPVRHPAATSPAVCSNGPYTAEAF